MAMEKMISGYSARAKASGVLIQTGTKHGTFLTRAVSWGLTGDIPVVGDWNGDGKDDIGIFRPSKGIWSLDSNGNSKWDISDKSVSWGLTGDIPVVGDWNGDGKDDIGIFRPSNGIWSLDSNGNNAWDVSDKSVSWGLSRRQTG